MKVASKALKGLTKGQDTENFAHKTLKTTSELYGLNGHDIFTTVQKEVMPTRDAKKIANILVNKHLKKMEKLDEWNVPMPAEHSEAHLELNGWVDYETDLLKQLKSRFSDGHQEDISRAAHKAIRTRWPNEKQNPTFNTQKDYLEYGLLSELRSWGSNFVF